LILRTVTLAALVMAAGCGSLGKAGKITEYVAPGADARSIKRVALIAGGANRGDRQVMARARERFTAAGITLIRRSGEWGSNSEALKEICVEKPESPENVDGVMFVSWDNLVLHECKTGTIATSVSGSYAGIDKLVDRMIYYLGGTPQAPTK
jgi:hypothetical protein